MAKVTFQGNPIETVGDLPKMGENAPDFQLTKNDLSDVSLADFSGKIKVINIFPSVDTSVCASSVKEFNKRAESLGDTVILCVSADLPFASSRFCATEGLNNVISLSSFRSSFADDYGVRISEGPLKGLCSRAVIVIGKDNRVLYSEHVKEISQQPNYDEALKSIKE